VGKGWVIARNTDGKVAQLAMHVRTHNADHDDRLGTEKVLRQVT
jgi:hypothetical protein